MRAGIALSFTDLESRRRGRGLVEAHAVQIRLADVEREVALRVRSGSGRRRGWRGRGRRGRRVTRMGKWSRGGGRGRGEGGGDTAIFPNISRFSNRKGVFLLLNKLCVPLLTARYIQPLYMVYMMHCYISSSTCCCAVIAIVVVIAAVVGSSGGSSSIVVCLLCVVIVSVVVVIVIVLLL